MESQKDRDLKNEEYTGSLVNWLLIIDYANKKFE